MNGNEMNRTTTYQQWQYVRKHLFSRLVCSSIDDLWFERLNLLKKKIMPMRWKSSQEQWETKENNNRYYQKWLNLVEKKPQQQKIENWTQVVDISSSLWRDFTLNSVFVMEFKWAGTTNWCRWCGIPLNWCWHSSEPSMWPSPSAINASGASLHNCRCVDVKPGTRLQIIDDAKLHTILK